MSDLIERGRELAGPRAQGIESLVGELVDEIERLEVSDLTHREQRDNWKAAYEKANDELKQANAALKAIAHKEPINKEWGNQGIDADRMQFMALTKLETDDDS